MLFCFVKSSAEVRNLIFPGGHLKIPAVVCSVLVIRLACVFGLQAQTSKYGMIAALSAGNTIHVSTTLEFLEAIGSNRTIYMEDGTYALSGLSSEEKALSRRFQQGFMEYEIEISNVENLRIVGGASTKIAAEPEWGYSLVLKNCTNVLIENIVAGHEPAVEGCAAGVLYFKDSENIVLSNCDLYGSGVEGIYATNVNYLECNEVIIRECSDAVMSLSSCRSVYFNDCRFENNSGYWAFFSLSGGGIVNFNRCEIINNKSSSTKYLFDVDEKSVPIILNGCKIRSNRTEYFCSRRNKINLNQTKLTENEFLVSQFEN